MELFVDIPVANALKLTDTSKIVNKRASFDQIRFALAEHTTLQDRNYCQPFEQGDELRLQFLTNYPINTVSLTDSAGAVVETGAATLLRQYLGLYYRSTCFVTSYQGKAFVYFQDGNEFTDEDFLVVGDSFQLGGRLPSINAEAGDVVRLSIQGDPFEGDVIQGVFWNSAVKAEGYLLTRDLFLTSPVEASIEIKYDQLDGNLYEYQFDLSALTGVHYANLLLELNEEVTKLFLSEPINVQALHPDTLAIDFKHVGDFDSAFSFEYLYVNGYTRLRMPSNHHSIVLAGDVDAYSDDNGALSKVRALPLRKIKFKAFNLPAWIIDKLNVAVAHDTILINEYFWQSEDFGSYEEIDRTDIGQFEIELTQVNNRLKRTDAEEVELTAEFDPDLVEDVAFAGDVVIVTFSSNTPFVFSFANLPAWITPDVTEFSDGDDIELTISANAGSIGRAIDLIAITESLSGLLGTLPINQLFDVVAEYIDTDIDTVNLTGLSGEDQLINVSSSGDYDITTESGFVFTIVKESGYSQIRITTPSDNVTGVDREAVVRLTLQSNPAIYTEVAVTQIPALSMISVTEDEYVEVPAGGESIDIDVVTLAGTQWQMSSSASWIQVSGVLYTGSQTVQFTVNELPVHSSGRAGYVYLTNISNPSDQLIIDVQQLTEN